MQPQEFLEQATNIARGTQSAVGRPKQIDLRNAINRAYYALFHTVAITHANAATSQNARAQ